MKPETTIERRAEEWAPHLCPTCEAGKILKDAVAAMKQAEAQVATLKAENEQMREGLIEIKKYDGYTLGHVKQYAAKILKEVGHE